MRILLSAHDVELALDMLAPLEDAGHRVEHVFDLEEALLRAAIAWPDAVIVSVGAGSGGGVPLGAANYALLRRFAEEHTIPLCLVAPPSAAAPPKRGGAPRGEGSVVARLARRLGATYFERSGARASTQWSAAFVDVVETAVRKWRHETKAVDEPVDPFAARKRSGTVAVPRPLLLAVRSASAAEVIAAFVRTTLGLRCTVASSASGAALALRDDDRLGVVLLDRRLLVEPEGRDLAAMMHDRGVTSVPLRVPEDEDPASMGRAAWDAIPGLRVALAAYRARSA